MDGLRDFASSHNMSRLAKSLLDWVRSQSDLTQTSLSVVTVSATLPLLSSLSPTGLASLNLTSLALQLGTQTWVGLVAGPTMFMHMPRLNFGDIQSRLFPKMGMVCVGTGILSLASYSLTHQTDTATYLLAASLASNMTNSFLLFPVVTNLMFQLRKHKEGSEERKTVGMKFGILHSISILFQLASMGMNFAYFWIVADRVASLW